MVYNGKPTREWLSREDTSSTTASTEAIFITASIDAHEGRDIMVLDVPNAFIQTEIPESGNDERIIMKITGVLVNMLVELDPEVYGKHVVFENKRKVLYVVVLRAIYGMLESALLFYKKFRKDLETIGFIFNPYDPCVANRTIEGSQHTIRFHVDDVMSSHMSSKVNDEFKNWMNKNYGSYCEVKESRGKIHDYLGMKFDFTEKGKVKIRMEEYVKNMIKDFPVELKDNDTAPTPAANNLFEKGKRKFLDKKRSEEYHTCVAKGLFLAKRARPDIHPAIAVLSTRVVEPNESDW